jgi:hypothetical protein
MQFVDNFFQRSGGRFLKTTAMTVKLPSVSDFEYEDPTTFRYPTVEIIEDTTSHRTLRVVRCRWSKGRVEPAQWFALKGISETFMRPYVDIVMRLAQYRIGETLGFAANRGEVQSEDGRQIAIVANIRYPKVDALNSFMDQYCGGVDSFRFARWDSANEDPWLLRTLDGEPLAPGRWSALAFCNAPAKHGTILIGSPPADDFDALLRTELHDSIIHAPGWLLVQDRRYFRARRKARLLLDAYEKSDSALNKIVDLSRNWDTDSVSIRAFLCAGGASLIGKFLTIGNSTQASMRRDITDARARLELAIGQ